jgi:zona occludens toxin (predicted ATPase)
MKKNQLISINGSLQPLLFCIGMYFVVLIFSIFICSSLYYAINDPSVKTEQAPVQEKETTAQLVASLTR